MIQKYHIDQQQSVKVVGFAIQQRFDTKGL